MPELCDFARITVGTTARPSATAGQQVYYVRVAAIDEGKIAESWAQAGPEPARAEEARLRLGDILVRLRAGRVVAAVVETEQVGAYPTLDAILVRPKPEAEAYFLCAVLNDESAQAALAAAWRGTALARLTVADLSRLPIPAVPRPRQRLIGALAEVTYKERRLLAGIAERRALFHREVLRRAVQPEEAGASAPRDTPFPELLPNDPQPAPSVPALSKTSFQ